MNIIAPLTLPFRALRFAHHLVRIGQTHVIFKWAAQIAGHLSAIPWSLCHRRRRDWIPLLRTDHPVALDSPDHLHPHGTAINNVTNLAFVRRMTDLYGQGAFLDLGCSSGRLVRDFAQAGWLAVGLEGSDYSARQGRGQWGRLRNLFTCDISRPFQLTGPFNVITAWDVVEHLDGRGLDQLIANVLNHLAPGGIFIVTTANNSEIQGGMELHQTQWPRERWAAYFSARGLCELDRASVLLRTEMVRHSADGGEFVLCRAGDGARVPTRSRDWHPLALVLAYLASLILLIGTAANFFWP